MIFAKRGGTGPAAKLTPDPRTVTIPISKTNGCVMTSYPNHTSETLNDSPRRLFENRVSTVVAARSEASEASPAARAARRFFLEAA